MEAQELLEKRAPGHSRGIRTDIDRALQKALTERIPRERSASPEERRKQRKPLWPKAYHSIVPKKAPGKDIKRSYGLTLEFGFLVALAIIILLFRMPMQFDGEMEVPMVEQEVVQMEEILQTHQEKPPPPPPKPRVPVAVADDVILDDFDLDLDATLDIGEELSELPPPPPLEEPEEVVEEDFEEEIFIAVEEMPEMIGGIAALQSIIEYPELARQAGVEGRVFVQFIVNQEGNVVDPVVIRGIGAGCDEEAIRAVKTLQFKPGKQRGKAVKVKMMLPVTFRLRNPAQ